MTKVQKELAGLPVKVDPTLLPGTVLIVPKRKPGETDEELAKRSIVIRGLGEE